MKMKHIFIINPAAGQGKSLGVIRPKIEEVCEKYSLDCEIYITKAQGDGIEFVRERAETGEEIRFYKNIISPTPSTFLLPRFR